MGMGILAPMPMLGDVLRAWRISQGLSQVEAAEKVEVNQSTWSDWESGKNTPRVHTAHRLSELVGPSVIDAILADDRAQP
jgi:transcriptional regulator with XRE-family HTH domain